MKLVRFWFKIFTRPHILIWSFYNASDFELKKIQRLRFWNETLSTCQIFKNICIQINDVSFLFTPWKRHFLIFSCFSKKNDFELKFSSRGRFWIEKNTMRQNLSIKEYIASYSVLEKYNSSDLESEKYNAWDFESRKIQRVRFSVQNFTTCQMLSVRLLQFEIFLHLSKEGLFR